MSYIVIEGNLTADPEVNFAQESGKAYARLNVAVNNRAKQQDGTWTDGPTSFYRVTTFGARAENAGNSFHKGDTVLVAGNLTVQGFTRADGTTGLSHEITAEQLGASVLYGTVAISKTTKTDSSAE